MELAPQKRQLLTQQHDERAALVADLEQLQADYHKELEHVRRQARKKAFTREITRARRYHEEKNVWEYLNNLIEDIHLFTWRKTVTASCTANYQRKRYLLEQELRDQQAHHRKERITLRYVEGGIPKATAFVGRWLITPEQPWEGWDEEGQRDNYAVALTAKDNVVVFNFCNPPEKGEFGWGVLTVNPSFEQANKRHPWDAIELAMRRRGIAVQELDI